VDLHEVADSVRNKFHSPNPKLQATSRHIQITATHLDSLHRFSNSHSQVGIQDNFKVVVRIRPPLDREKTGNFFQPIVEVSKDRKTVSIMEYLGQELDERERDRDIEENP
jgi:kinesin family protein 3/17